MTKIEVETATWENWLDEGGRYEWDCMDEQWRIYNPSGTEFCMVAHRHFMDKKSFPYRVKDHL